MVKTSLPYEPPLGDLFGSTGFISRLIRKLAPECAVEPAISARALLKDLLGSVRTRHPTTARIGRGSQIREQATRNRNSKPLIMRV